MMDRLVVAGEGCDWRSSESGDMTWFGAVFELAGVGGGPSGCYSLDGPLLWPPFVSGFPPAH